jgi:hypothetical protein
MWQAAPLPQATRTLRAVSLSGGDRKFRNNCFLFNDFFVK